MPHAAIHSRDLGYREPLPQETGVVRLSREALLFTARLGKGEILVCTLDILKALKEKRPRQTVCFISC